MKFLITTVIALCLSTFFASSQVSNNPTNRVFTIPELQEDFNTLRSKYENNLANLYLYISKPELDKIFDSLYQHIVPMTEAQFYNYITPFQSIVKDGHSLILPSEASTAYHRGHDKYLPFQLYWHNGHLYTTMNLSADETIKDGTEILSINGKDAQTIMDYLTTRQVRDGYNETYPLWILNHYFRSYYNMAFGYPDSYSFKIKTPAGEEKSITIPASSQQDIATYKAARYKQRPAAEKGIEFEIKNNTAILTIRTWDTKTLKKEYHQHFKQEIDKAFAQIKQTNTHHLVIDLRDNQGGNTAYGDYLLSWLLQQPYQYTTGLYKVAAHTDSGQTLKSKKAAFTRMQFMRLNSYEGKLYVLINGGSFSNSGIFSSALQRYRKVSFIGEEAAGNKAVLSGVFGIKGKTILPNTHIICDKANYRMVITKLEENTGHGVMPDITVTATIEDILSGRDVAMEKALEMTKQQ